MKLTFPFKACKCSISSLTICVLLLLAGAASASAVASSNDKEEQAEPEYTYSYDMSFPSMKRSVSTNYPWLPHNVDPKNNPTPEEYKDMPIQPLGNRQKVYEDFIQGCRDYWNKKLNSDTKGSVACDVAEDERFEEQASSMVNYTDVGYKKIKAPEHVFKMISDFWNANKDKNLESIEQWYPGSIYVNNWVNEALMLNIMDEDLTGGGSELYNAIWSSTTEIISDWVGYELQCSAVYGIRVYQEGAILSPHVDTLPRISSAIINVDQDLDEDWPLEVIGHDGIARNISMAPGDMVLYESHSVMHSRPFAMKGRYFANIFIHFMPIPTKEQIEDHVLPAYIVPGSIVAKEWEEGEYYGEIVGSPKPKDGEEIDEDEDEIDEDEDQAPEAHEAVFFGDLSKLKALAKESSKHLHVKDDLGWQPIHEAVRYRNYDVIKYLHSQGVDMNSMTYDDQSVLDIAHEHKPKYVDDEEHGDYMNWLVSLGATVTAYEFGPDL